MATSFVLNGKSVTLEADPAMPLLWAVREVAGLTGTKFGCGMALCGACTVHLDGQAVRSCVLPLGAVAGRGVTTIEGLAGAQARAVQAAWVSLQVPQCGYCQSGQVMSATALLEKNPSPSDADIDLAMSGNICRCATYSRIRAAIHAASQVSQAAHAAHTAQAAHAAQSAHATQAAHTAQATQSAHAAHATQAPQAVRG